MDADRQFRTVVVKWWFAKWSRPRTRDHDGALGSTFWDPLTTTSRRQGSGSAANSSGRRVGQQPAKGTIVAFDITTSRPDTSSTLEAVYARYQAERRLGPRTRTEGNYGLAWSGLTRWLKARLERDAVAADLTTASLTDYLAAGRAERKWSEQTTKTYAGNIRSVVSGCVKRGILPRDTLLGFEPPAVTSRPPVFFDDPTLALIFDALEAYRTVAHLRLRVVANIMLDCGARPEEIAGLTFADLFEGSSEIRFDGKNSKVRIVPVGERTWEYLRDYMRVRPSPLEPRDPVLVDVRSGRNAISPDALGEDMRELLVELGLVDPEAPVATEKDGRLSLYTFRKTFARRAAAGGMDVAELGAIMGHSAHSLGMLLRVYYQVSDEQKQAAHAIARPADRLHDWRQSPTRAVVAPKRALSFFEEFSAPARMTARGNMPSRAPSSRSRTSGAYRDTSASTSRWATGA